MIVQKQALKVIYFANRMVISSRYEVEFTDLNPKENSLIIVSVTQSLSQKFDVLPFNLSTYSMVTWREANYLFYKSASGMF